MATSVQQATHDVVDYARCKDATLSHYSLDSELFYQVRRDVQITAYV